MSCLNFAVKKLSSHNELPTPRQMKFYFFFWVLRSEFYFQVRLARLLVLYTLKNSFKQHHCFC